MDDWVGDADQPASRASIIAQGIDLRMVAQWVPRFRRVESAECFATRTSRFGSPAASASHNNMGGQLT